MKKWNIPNERTLFRLYEAMVLDQFENKIRVLWSYGGGEYFEKEFEDYLETKGIRHESSIIQPKIVFIGRQATIRESYWRKMGGGSIIKMPSHHTQGKHFQQPYEHLRFNGDFLNANITLFCYSSAFNFNV